MRISSWVGLVMLSLVGCPVDGAPGGVGAESDAGIDPKGASESGTSSASGGSSAGFADAASTDSATGGLGASGFADKDDGETQGRAGAAGHHAGERGADASDAQSDAIPAEGSIDDPSGDPERIDCDGTRFLDAVRQWTEVTVNGGGMDAIRQAIEQSNLRQPTRIRIAAGVYSGRCLYVEDHLRTREAPLWVQGQGEVRIDCVDGNGQAIALQHSSYIALEGLTIGPELGAYGDSAVHISGSPVSPSDPHHYGEWLPSHHIIVKNLTARNLNRGADGDGDPDAYESGCCDAVKTNQSEWIWILDSRASRTARHGFDNVGVHHLAICDNTLTDMVGAGFAMEAKGGSRDVLMERNFIRRTRHRAIVLGGEGTDNVFMWPANAAYEGSQEIARNNVVVNAAEAGLGFYGCRDCAAVNNTVWIEAGYATSPHDLFRSYNSIMEGATDLWVTGGSARRVGDILPNENNRLVGNLMGAAFADMTCSMNAGEGGVIGLTMHHNIWYNGGFPLPECGDGELSIAHYPDPSSRFGSVDPHLVHDQILTGADATPDPKSPLLSAGALDLAGDDLDFLGRQRRPTPSVGAIEP